MTPRSWHEEAQRILDRERRRLTTAQRIVEKKKEQGKDLLRQLLKEDQHEHNA